MIDRSDLPWVIPLAVMCLVVSALCSGTELALLSIRRLERGQLAHSRRPTERRIAAILERPRRLVATMLVGNEACNNVLAILAFAVLVGEFDPLAAMGLAIAVVLPLIVVVTEITAKTLAAQAPLAWSRVFVLPLTAFALVVAPVRIVLQAVAALVLRPFGVSSRPRAAHDLSAEEFRTLVDAGSAQGQVDARERRLIHRVFEFHDKNVGQVMTPRDRIFALSYDLPTQRLIKELAARGFSRVPIYQRSLDNVRGILNAKDLVRTAAAGQPLGRPLGELLHEPLFVPRTTPVKRLFLTFKQKKVHMAIVVSEYGKVLGLVTMDDLLAQIFGVLRDERAELQSTIPPPRGTVRIPVDGRSDAAPGDPGERDRRAAGDPGSAGARDPVQAGSGDPGDRSGPVIHPDLSPGAAIGVLDPPPRPVHVVDEVTPPATDIAELQRGGRDADDQGKPS